MTSISTEYYSTVRFDIFDMLDANTIYPEVIELGCGSGATLKALKDKKRANTVLGYEKVAHFKDSHSESIDHYEVWDIEKELPLSISTADLVLVLDVIEHLYDPWLFLLNLTSKMKSGATLILSTPNICNIRILKKLILQDEWNYTDSGILDRTHLRFFTTQSLTRALHSLNAQLIQQEYNWEDLPLIWVFKKLPFLNRFFACQIRLKIKIK